MHHGEYGDLVAEPLFVEQRAVAFDESRLLERAHPAKAGRRGNPDPARQLDVGNTAVPLQLVEDLPIDGVETSGHEGLRIRAAQPRPQGSSIARSGPARNIIARANRPGGQNQ